VNTAPEPRKTADQIRERLQCSAKLAVVLGSGFGKLAECVAQARSMAVAEADGFAPVNVVGHAGRIICGELAGREVLLLAGRAHYYEGHSMEQVTFPMRVLAELGIGTVLLTNAAGAINPAFGAGDFMALSDHINFIGVNPLAGVKTERSRFVDLTEVYDSNLRSLLVKSAPPGTKVHQGVYIAVSGPTYETPAEIRAFRTWGADAVGMSTVPEAIVAHQCGIRVAALSCLTNKAAGVAGTKLNHQEVLAQGDKSSRAACEIIAAFVAGA